MSRGAITGRAHCNVPKGRKVNAMFTVAGSVTGPPREALAAAAGAAASRMSAGRHGGRESAGLPEDAAEPPGTVDGGA